MPPPIHVLHDRRRRRCRGPACSRAPAVRGPTAFVEVVFLAGRQEHVLGVLGGDAHVHLAIRAAGVGLGLVASQLVLDPHRLGFRGGEVRLRTPSPPPRPFAPVVLRAATVNASAVPSGSSFSPGMPGTTHALFPSLSKEASTGSVATRSDIPAKNGLILEAERKGTSVETPFLHFRREFHVSRLSRPESGSKSSPRSSASPGSRSWSSPDPVRPGCPRPGHRAP